jgi:LAO/AO transport system kinase
MSALTGAGVADFWEVVLRYLDRQRESGRFERRRHEQNQAWMWERIEAGLRQRFRDHPGVAAALPHMTEEVRGGRIAASVAARRLLDLMN